MTTEEMLELFKQLTESQQRRVMAEIKEYVAINEEREQRKYEKRKEHDNG